MDVSIKTFGCALNQADSAAMQGVLEQAGHRVVPSDGADVCVVNTCTVKGPTERKIRREVRRLEAQGKRVVLAGCLTQTKHGQSLFPRHSIVGTKNLGSIARAVVSEAPLRIVADSQEERMYLPGAIVHGIVGIVPINEGCLSACSFCATKEARGNTKSYARDDILKHIQSMVDHGVREVWLTSPDTGTYGVDSRDSLPELVRSVAALRGGFKVRIGMANPDHVRNFVPELIEAMRSERVFKFLHIPVQSGSDRVLKHMRRRHSARDFVDIVQQFRAVFPGITIATDIIVGYPVESEDDFEQTLALIRDVRPEVLNMSRYWPRPNTTAARLPQLPSEVVMSRSKRLNALFREIALETNKRRIGWQGKCLIEENQGDSSTARDPGYRPVVISKVLEPGAEVNVVIGGATWLDLRGQVVSEE